MSHSPEEVLRSFLFFSCNNRRRIYQDNSTIETMKTSFCNLDTFQKSRWVKLGIFQGFSSTKINYTFPVPPKLKSLFLNESNLGYTIPAISFMKNSIENIYMQGNLLQ